MGRDSAGPGKRGHVSAWPLDAGINVVLFAGLGGACAGLEAAGLPVHVAVNHSDVAIAAHRALHPHTAHFQGDIFDVDPIACVRGRRVKALWASPDCRDHSAAKGCSPRSPRVRSMPWQICRWSAKVSPEVVFVENVREIRQWGPLVAARDHATGRVIKADKTVAAPGERVPVRDQLLVRDKSRLGKTFRRWKAHVEKLGYQIEDRDLCAADYGVPTSRRRYFLVGRRDGRPIEWPVPTHAPRERAKALKLKSWRGAEEIIDWNLPLPSIFDRPKMPVEKSLRRLAQGMKRYVLDAQKPFLVHFVPIRLTQTPTTSRPSAQISA